MYKMIDHHKETQVTEFDFYIYETIKSRRFKLNVYNI